MKFSIEPEATKKREIQAETARGVRNRVISRIYEAHMWYFYDSVLKKKTETYLHQKWTQTAVDIKSGHILDDDARFPLLRSDLKGRRLGGVAAPVMRYDFQKWH